MNKRQWSWKKGGGKDEKKTGAKRSRKDEKKHNKEGELIIGAQPIPKIQHTTVDASVMGALFKVPRDQIGALQWMKIRKELTIYPKQRFIPGLKRQPVPVPYNLWGEDKDYFVMPPRYGMENVGLPAEDLQFRGKPWKDTTIEFKGKLWGEGDVFNQQEVMDHAEEHFRQTGLGGVLNLATSSGKTILYLYRMWLRKLKTLIVVPLGVLIEQWKSRIEQFLPGLRVGILRRDKMQIGDDYDVTIAMLHSIAKRKYPVEIYKDIGMCCFDEIHVLPARTFWKVLQQLGRIRILDGLSATMERTDGMEKLLYQYLGGVIWRSDPKTASSTITDVQISVFKCGDRVVETQPDSEKLSPSETLKSLSKDPLRNRLLLQHIQEDLEFTGPIGQKHCILWMSPLVSHCEYIYNECKRKWPQKRIVHYSEKLSPEDRKAVSANPQDIVIGTDRMLGMGFDLGYLTALHIGLPMVKILQVIGRLRCTSAKFDETTMRLRIRDICDTFVHYPKQFKSRQSQYALKCFKMLPFKIIDSEEDITHRQTRINFKTLEELEEEDSLKPPPPKVEFDFDDADADEIVIG